MWEKSIGSIGFSYYLKINIRYFKSELRKEEIINEKKEDIYSNKSRKIKISIELVKIFQANCHSNNFQATFFLNGK